MSVTTPGGRVPHPSAQDGVSHHNSVIDLRAAEQSITLDPHPLPSPFTRRQREILRHVADGLSNAEIAFTLGISRRTVEKHIEAIHMKAGTGSRPRLVAFAAATRSSMP